MTRPISFDKIIPGGVLTTDKAQPDQGAETCSRCGRAIREDEVPIIIWGMVGTWVYCNDCDGMTAHRRGEPEEVWHGG